MAKRNNLAGRKFNRLTFMKFTYRRNDKYYWECKCDCGNLKIIRSDSVIEGKVKSCGCLNAEVRKEKAGLLMEETRKQLYKGTRVTLLGMSSRSNNTTGCVGVRFNRRLGKYIASITIQGKRIHLGCFNEIDDAIKTRKEAEEKYFKPIIEEFNEVRKDESIKGIN